MYAECARTSCAQQACVLLAFDPRGARAWLRDLGDANPAMGLMLCGDHAETTTVPMSWTLIDERSPDMDRQMDNEVDGPPPSFDDIFPPRAAREPDPYGLDPDLDERPAGEPDAVESADEARDQDISFDIDHAYDEHEYHEAVELLAPELPASGTDGAAIRQPQLPMISTPAREHTDVHPHQHYTHEGRNDPRAAADSTGITSTGITSTGITSDYLFSEGPEDRLPDATYGPLVPGSAPHFGIGPSTTAQTSSPQHSAPGPSLGSSSSASAPLFEKTATHTPRMAPPTSPLLSRAFRSSHTE